MTVSENTKVLVVEDDIDICESLVELLSPRGYEVKLAHEGDAGLALARSGDFDLIILDVMLPKMSGLRVLQELKPSIETPVIMLTTRGEEVDRITGLTYGAEDYLAKPFSTAELLLRIQIILKRHKGQLPEKGLQIGELKIDMSAKQAYFKNKPIKLTFSELGILKELMSSSGDIISRDHLTRSVLGRELSPYDRSISTHINNLRNKLAHISRDKPLIRSVRSKGYFLDRSALE